ncbi:phosphoribosylanthranilate isomerase [Methylovirgula sp. HY1]|uniref:phosphoribosylanthranilate isomerase n=1 Tax=Methylovirgula sp. HY1 TaxID=2822761 RepID=UPI001C5BB4A0|nr:phosphoribosylanthranilate isomerase [Methylovirgula sp. HY1]QXX76185.1 N-(5'-phosphoribosyl)anthranilate isomerase [Methylovirgula sp. HY1]
MSVIVKICGLSTPEMVDAALNAGADMVGFVHYETSPRHVPLDVAASLSQRVGDRAVKVLVTVDMADMALAAAVAAVKPHALQLHGHERPDRVSAISGRFGLPVIKAIRIGGKPGDIGRISSYEDVADLLLFDAAPAADGSGLPGGNGTSFDWTFLPALNLRTPWLLAGGLRPDNVGEAVMKAGAYGVDVSSGVESGPGIKDAGKIAAFVANARAAAKALG